MTRGVKAALVIAALACGNGSTAPTGGSLTIGIRTIGTDLDPDGYTVILDSAPPRGVGINDTLVLPDVPAGEHTVELGGVRSNCLPFGRNPLTVLVESGGSTDVPIDVECFLRTGVLQIRTFTSGSGGELEGFIVRIGTVTRSIARTGQIAVTVPPGTHEVLLDGLTDECAVDGNNPEVISVDPEETVRVTFVVTCSG